MREDVDTNVDTSFGVYATNWPSLNIFWATWNAWRKIQAGNGLIIRDGIDWAQVNAALSCAGIKRSQWPIIFNDLQAIESTVLEYLNRDS